MRQGLKVGGAQFHTVWLCYGLNMETGIIYEECKK